MVSFHGSYLSTITLIYIVIHISDIIKNGIKSNNLYVSFPIWLWHLEDRSIFVKIILQNWYCFVLFVLHGIYRFFIPSRKDRFYTVRLFFTCFERFIVGFSSTMIASFDVIDYRRIIAMETTIITIYWIHIMWVWVFTSQL